MSLTREMNLKSGNPKAIARQEAADVLDGQLSALFPSTTDWRCGSVVLSNGAGRAFIRVPRDNTLQIELKPGDDGRRIAAALKRRMRQHARALLRAVDRISL